MCRLRRAQPDIASKRIKVDLLKYVYHASINAIHWLGFVSYGLISSQKKGLLVLE